MSGRKHSSREFSGLDQTTSQAPLFVQSAHLFRESLVESRDEGLREPEGEHKLRTSHEELQIQVSIFQIFVVQRVFRILCSVCQVIFYVP